MSNSECFLCNFENFIDFRKKFNLTENRTLLINCPKCGRYEITYEAAIKAKNENVSVVSLQGYIKYYSLRNESFIPINKTNLQSILDSPIIPNTVSQKLNIFLLNLNEKTNFAGENIKVEFLYDLPLAFAQNEDELKFLLSELTRLDYIKTISSSENHWWLQILTSGWEKIESLNEKSIELKQCFVAMSFEKKLDIVYDKAISLAIRDSGFKPFRIDREEHTDLIPFRMLAELKKSRFIVADFTQHKNGVYFEAGFGIGANKPVIWICDSSDFDETHFDIKQFNHILYDNLEDLYEKLKTRIEALII